MKETQKEMVLGFLEDECGGISPLEALNKFGCFRLADVIFKLRRDGYNIKTVDEHKNGKTYARYFLITGQRCRCPRCDAIFDKGEASYRALGEVECPCCGEMFDPTKEEDALIYEDVEKEIERDYWRTR